MLTEITHDRLIMSRKCIEYDLPRNDVHVMMSKAPSTATLLHAAAVRGDVERVTEVLSHRRDIHRRDCHAWQWAVVRGWKVPTRSPLHSV